MARPSPFSFAPARIAAVFRRGGARRPASLVPVDGSAARSLGAVVAVLTFLACLAAGAGDSAVRTASRWTNTVFREATIQVRPRRDRVLSDDLARAAELARATPGIAAATVLDRNDAEALLAPWLGRGLDFRSLPVPGLVTLRIADGAAPDLAGLRARVAAAVPAATLDDHGGWASQMGAFGTGIAGAAAAIVLGVIGAAGLAVAFATRGAVAASRDVVEVLALVGAAEGYVVRRFASGFASVGAAGAAVGGGGATLVLAGLRRLVPDEPTGAGALAGLLEPGPSGFVAIGLVAAAVAGVAAIVSALAVRRQLRAGPTGGPGGLRSPARLGAPTAGR